MKRGYHDKRNEVSENDIPDIIERFNNLDIEVERKRTEQSFFVPVEEISKQIEQNILFNLSGICLPWFME